MDRTDEELIAAYIEGNESAFTALTERHLKTVYSFVFRLMGDSTEAEDITQDIFFKAWKNIENYRAESSKFKTWILRIARNATIDYLRKKKHIPLSYFTDEEGYNAIVDTIEDSADLPEAVFAKVEDVQALQKALLTLPPEAREIITLHYTSGLTFLEIADIVGEPQNTVKSRHYRSIRALREAYTKMISSAPNS